MGILDDITASQNSTLAAPGAYDAAQQANNLNIQQQGVKAQTANQQNDLQTKQRQMQLSMLSGVLNEPDPEKQRQILGNIVPIANKLNPSYQIDPSIDIPTVRALVASQHPSANAPIDASGLGSLNPLIKTGLQSGELGLKDVIAAQASNPFMNISGPSTAPMDGATPQSAIDQLPEAMKPTVQGIIDGRILPPNPNSRAPGAQALLQAVAAVDPTFDSINAGSRQKTRNDFTSGTSAKSINALNTVAGHLENLQKAGDALNNFDTPALNSVANYASQQTGDARVNNFNVAKNAVADELAKAYKGGVVSDSEAHKWDSVLNANSSPEQLHGAITEISDLLQSKLEALNNQYAQGMGTAANGKNFITPETQAVFDKMQGKASSQLPSQMQPKGQGIQPGHIEGGYIYMGGDPSKPESWKAAK